MFSLIFCSLRATALTFLKNSLKLIKDKTFEIIPKYERTVAKVCLKVVERKIIFETHQLILVLYFTMLAVMLSELVLIFFFFLFVFLRIHIFGIFMLTFQLALTRNTLNLLHITFIFT